jgi:hypothetical protein
MGWPLAIVLVLGMIYFAAIVLAVRDRMVPQPDFIPRVPSITQHPHFRTIRWFILPVLLPLWLFVLALWAIVFLPVFLWRGVSMLAYRLTKRCS